ncbi:MAG: ferritin-like domain-containing protein, partial [Planctomycetota bacterium]
MTDAPIDLGELGLDAGGAVLLRLGLAERPVGAAVAIAGSAPDLAVHLRAFARAEGHGFAETPAAQRLAGPRAPAGAAVVATLARGEAAPSRWRGAARAGTASASGAVDHPKPHGGLAARGAMVAAGAPEFRFALADRDEVWADDAGALYREAAAAQWDPG